MCQVEREFTPGGSMPAIPPRPEVREPILSRVVASAVRTAGWIRVAIQPTIHFLAEFMIIVALTAIGLSANLRRMIASGAKPILLGLGVWAAVSVSSLLVQLVIGQL